jgi:hypothetical protein
MIESNPQNADVEAAVTPSLIRSVSDHFVDLDENYTDSGDENHTERGDENTHVEDEQPSLNSCNKQHKESSSLASSPAQPPPNYEEVMS